MRTRHGGVCLLGRLSCRANGSSSCLSCPSPSVSVDATFPGIGVGTPPIVGIPRILRTTHRNVPILMPAQKMAVRRRHRRAVVRRCIVPGRTYRMRPMILPSRGSFTSVSRQQSMPTVVRQMRAHSQVANTWTSKFQFLVALRVSAVRSKARATHDQTTSSCALKRVMLRCPATSTLVRPNNGTARARV